MYNEPFKTDIHLKFHQLNFFFAILDHGVKVPIVNTKPYTAIFLFKGELGGEGRKSRCNLKTSEHSSTSVICREAKEPHIERILNL